MEQQSDWEAGWKNKSQKNMFKVSKECTSAKQPIKYLK